MRLRPKPPTPDPVAKLFASPAYAALPITPVTHALCEDAYTQERAVLTQILPRVQANDLFVADRNFFTTRFVFGISAAKAAVIVRQHRTSLPCQPLETLKPCGTTSTGLVYEQRVQATDPDTEVIHRRGWRS